MAATAAALPFSKSLFDKSESNPVASRINHSVCKWCFPDYSVAELADFAARIGMGSVELLRENEWPVVIERGLTCAIGYASTVPLNKGFNDPSLHEKLKKEYEAAIPKAADHGLTQVISFSGNRNGISDEVGMENCARGLEPVIKIAEKYNIVVSMELLNSKINHPDYQADKTEWMVELVDKVGSPNFKILYDIYHMQVQEGDIIATIQKYADYIGHYHTAGVPGRHELNEEQELQYPAIMKAIVNTGYTGFVGHEFIPSSDNKLQSLEQAVKVCSV